MLNRQQIFEKVVKGMFAQGTDSPNNRYRDTKTKECCAIGQLIPAKIYKDYKNRIEDYPLVIETYNKDRDNLNVLEHKNLVLHKSLVNCLRRSGVLGQELNMQKIELLSDLQEWHDSRSYDTSKWKEQFRAIGRKHKLDTKFIKNLKLGEKV